MGKLGIDFGTSYSTLFAWDEARHQGIPIAERRRSDSLRFKIPSVAYWDDKADELRIGDRAVIKPEEYFFDEFSDEIDEDEIEKREQEVVPPEVVRQNYFEALQEVKDAEEKMKELLIKGGYVNE